MATVKILTGTSTFVAGDANTTYNLAENATLDTTGNGIDVDGEAKGRVFNINGKIFADTNAIVVDPQPAPFGGTVIHVGKSGVLEGGSNGIYAYGQGIQIINEGSISGNSSGVLLYGTNTLINSGTIHGGPAGLSLQSGNGEGMTVITNSGTISGFNYSILGSSEYETIINTGTLEGDVDLGGGDDFFVFKKGEVNGEVMGGQGDDTFTIRKAGLDIVEAMGEGNDTIYSSVSLTMAANVEDLYLTGKKDINATGGTAGNDIHGNVGRNTIDAGGGFDFIDGGRGNDILTGGSSADTFHFARGTGKDTITDYVHGFDEIEFEGLKGATDYADMVANHLTQKGADLWITYGDDIVVLKNTVKADLHAGDFDFG